VFALRIDRRSDKPGQPDRPLAKEFEIGEGDGTRAPSRFSEGVSVAPRFQETFLGLIASVPLNGL
jgi:hypothetical protein